MAGKKVTRREILGQATTASIGALSFPYIVSSSALGKAGTVAPSNRIVMGCIGMGGMGTGNMKGFLKNPDVQVVAVCDVNRESKTYNGDWVGGCEPAKRQVEAYYAQQQELGKYKGCTAYSDFRELLARKDIDAVTVCTPDHWHGLITIAAAKAGKDIYCEKPLVNTIAEGRAVCGAVKSNKRVLQTGSHERSTHTIRYACELVRNGRIGKLHTIRVNLPFGDKHHQEVLQCTEMPPTMPVPEGFDYDMWLGSTPKVPYTQKRCHFWWRFILAYGGGEMTDRGAHVIDIGQLGNNTDDTGPVELSAKGKAPASGLYDAFFDYEFECKYANGVRMIGSADKPRGLKFEGSDGWVFVHIHGGKLEASTESLLKETIGPDEIHLGRSPGDESRPAHHRNFLDAIKSRGQTMAPAEVGHRTATICHLLNISMQTGRKLKWDPQKEQILNDPEANKMLSRPMRSPWHL